MHWKGIERFNRDCDRAAGHYDAERLCNRCKYSMEWCECNNKPDARRDALATLRYQQRERARAWRSLRGMAWDRETVRREMRYAAGCIARTVEAAR